MNNVIIGTGQSPAGPDPVVNQPTQGWTNNVVTEGQTNFFVDQDGTNPNFVPAASATNLIGQGMSGNGVPTTDVGFDPKCIVKRTPVMVGQVAAEPWWQYDVDIDYVKSIGGVAKCFAPRARSGAIDMGAYNAGMVTGATPGNCTPPPVGMGGIGGTTGMAGMAGAGGAGTAGIGAGGTDAAGTAGLSTGGTGNVAGTTASAGAAPTAGAPPGTGGTVPTGEGGAMATGGAPAGTGGAPSTGGATANGGSVATGTDAGTPPEPSGCGCRLAPKDDRWRSLVALGLLGLSAIGFAKRRRSRGRREL
jgi:hypothetical protein